MSSLQCLLLSPNKSGFASSFWFCLDVRVLQEAMTESLGCWAKGQVETGNRESRTRGKYRSGDGESSLELADSGVTKPTRGVHVSLSIMIRIGCMHMLPKEASYRRICVACLLHDCFPLPI